MIHADQVTVSGRRGVLLEPTTRTMRTGERQLVTAGPGQSHSALTLVLAGRRRPTSGHLSIDGVADAAALRHAVALVDAPGVSEPDDALPVGTVVGEGLALAGLPRPRPRPRRQHLARRARRRVAARALRRARTADPHPCPRRARGGAPARPLPPAHPPRAPRRRLAGWWALAAELADREHGVLVQTTTAAACVLAAGLTSNPLLELL